MEMKVSTDTDQIIVRKNDDVNDIIQDFATKHQLNENKKAKLKKLVMQTLENYNKYNKTKKWGKLNIQYWEKH